MTTHAELVEQAILFLKRQRARVILTEMAGGSGEIADAIGWYGHTSTLIECKTSKADFNNDAKKYFRRMPERGMGNYRYYLVPPGLVITPPERWGLLVFNGKKFVKLVKSQYQKADTDGERFKLISAIQRIGQHPIKGVSVKCYTYKTKDNAQLHINTEFDSDEYDKSQTME